MERITIRAIINADIHKVWNYWTESEHIIKWNFASEEWHCPNAVNELKAGGKFSWRMEAKDGTMGFDFSGVYNSIDPLNRIEKTLDDDRKVSITFNENKGIVEIVESFEPDENDPELQRQGWQAILNNFRTYVELN